MQRFLRIAIVILVLAVFSSTAHSISLIRYQGSPAIAKFIEIASNVYLKSTFTTNVLTKSKGGGECLSNGSCDIGGVANELDPTILEKSRKAVLIGMDSVVVIVHDDNPVEILSIEQLRKIFSGEIKNWKELGGFDQLIEPVVTSPISATQELFKKLVMNKSSFHAKVMEPDSSILLHVARNRGAIGLTSHFMINPPQGVKAVKPNGEEVNLSNANYPLLRPLYLITNDPPRQDVQQFLDWVVSDEGQSLVKKYFNGIR